MTRNVTMTTGVLCGMLAASIAFAQETKQQDDLPQPRESRQNLQETQQRQRTGQNRQETRQGNRQAEMPTFLQQLDLTSEQEQGIRQALQQHDQKLRQTWQQFHMKHARAIQLESAWAAAVRDTLSEDDQRKFDQQRMQQKEMSRYGQSDDARRNGAERDDANRFGQNRERNQDRNSDRNRDASQADQNRDDNQDREGNRADNPNRGDRAGRQQESQFDSRTTRNEGNQNAQDGRQTDAGFVVIAVQSPEHYAHGSKQNAQQKQQCAEACREYKQELSNIWQELHRLHAELVQIEVDRIQAIEEELTEEQLTQLKEHRQRPEAETASTTRSNRRSR